MHHHAVVTWLILGSILVNLVNLLGSYFLYLRMSDVLATLEDMSQPPQETPPDIESELMGRLQREIRRTYAVKREG